MKKIKKYTTKSFVTTQKLGEKIAKEILKLELKNSAVVLGLQGDLGTGKTTFLQGFAKGLGVEEKILSPTFILMKKFKILSKKVPQNRRPSVLWYFYHFDCYRLNNPEEILHLSFKEIILNPQNIVAIEWPEKIADILPKNTILIKFNHLKENKREIIIDK